MNWYTGPLNVRAAAAKLTVSGFTALKMDTVDDPTLLGCIETTKRGDIVIDTPRRVGYSILDMPKLIRLKTHYKCDTPFYNGWVQTAVH